MLFAAETGALALKEGHSMRWYAIVAAMISPLISVVAAQEPTPTEAVAVPAEIAADLNALSAPEFAEREAASRRLLSRKSEVIAPLTELARTGTAEASVRAFDLLRQLYREGDDSVIESVESAYESLQKSENPIVASRAEARVEASVAVRHRRAVSAFLKLGGILRFRKPTELEQPVPDEATRPIEYAMLTPSWQGGDEGLKYLRRIEDFRVRGEFRGAHLFVIKGSKVSPDSLKELELSLPGLLIQRRGPSCLGVSPYTGFGNEEGLPISEVKPGSAADRAGLRPGDLIIKFNGHVVNDFETLVDRISETQPGDKVPVVFERNQSLDTVTVELRGWE